MTILSSSPLRSFALVTRRILLGALCVFAGPVLSVPVAAQEVTPEEAPVVKSIIVEGNRRYTADQIISTIGQLVDRPYIGRDEIDRGIKALFNLFKARVDVLLRPLGQRGEDGVELLYRVSELPLDLEPRFIGNVEYDTKKLLEWVGLEERSELFLFEAPRVREKLIQGYKQEGYYFVEVNVVERTGGIDAETGEEIAPDVIFEIKEGPKVKVRSVEITGNNTLPNRGFLFFKRGISRLAQTKLRGPRLWNFFSKALVVETLEADILAIREVYRDLGYLDVVVELERFEFSDDRSWVTIHIVVDEGGRYTIGSLEVVGVERYPEPRAPAGYAERPTDLAFTNEELKKLLKQRPGDIYERRKQKEDARKLRDKFGEQGYVDHRSLSAWDRWTFLEPELVFEEDASIVHVTYRIAQGHQIFIREIPIRGNLHTQDRVVRRQITVEPGQPANPEAINSSRQRLAGSGIFSDPGDINHSEPYYQFIETDDPNWKDLEFVVEEGQVLNFNLSGGVSSNIGAFGLISLSHSNFDLTNLPSSPWSVIGEIASREAFHGAGQEFRISASPGTQRSFFDIFFREPDIFRRHQNRISLSLNVRRWERRYSSHDEERNQVGFELGRQVALDSSIYAGYNIGTIDVHSLDDGSEPVIGEPRTVPKDLHDQEGKSDLAFLKFGYRYRKIDNRLSPRNGLTFVLDNELYDGAVGSDYEFLKTDVRFDWYDEFDEDEDIVSSRYHLGLAGGVMIPYGNTSSSPYTERFFLGGQRRMRGFEFRRVGPNEAGYPVGGQTYLFGTLEFRRPLVKQVQPGTYREIETIQGGLFLDVGVLDPNEFALDLGEVRASAGILFGISVPIPITFSIGWPLEEGSGDRTRIVSFSVGF